MKSARQSEGSSQSCKFYSPDDLLPDESVGYMMKRIVNSIVTQADKRLQVHGLTNAQWGPLLRLKNFGDSTVADLARWQSVDAGSMTRLLDRLEAKGLCQRIRSTEDRRVVNVQLTPEGREAIAEVPSVLCDILNDHLDGFTRAEWQSLKRMLARMLASGEALRESD